MSQFAKPSGFFGKIFAKGMAIANKDIYKITAQAIALKNDDKYLEIGFGSGLFIKKYVDNIKKIAGLDYSEYMVKLANNINKNLVESGNAEFKHGDVISIPWNDNEFSIIVAIETFFFWTEPKKALKEIYRVLMPGGRLVVEMSYNKEDGVNHTKIIKKNRLRLYHEYEMEKLLKDAGFGEVSITYFKGFWIPIRGYMVPKGMIVKAIKK